MTRSIRRRPACVYDRKPVCWTLCIASLAIVQLSACADTTGAGDLTSSFDLESSSSLESNASSHETACEAPPCDVDTEAAGTGEDTVASDSSTATTDQTTASSSDAGASVGETSGESDTDDDSGDSTGNDGDSWNAVGLELGHESSCAILDTGRIKCWGANQHGQLAIGRRFTEPPPRVLFPTLAEGVDDVAELALGMGFTCAIVESRQIRCWGSNRYGQLGDGTNDGGPKPRTVRGIENAIAIDAGQSHACAARKDGTVWCWGSNAFWQLGVDDVRTSAVPVQVMGVEGAVDVTCGEDHGCALLSDASAWCWGSDRSGELGVDGTSNGPDKLAGPVLNTNQVTAIDAGYGFTCAIHNGAEVICWGQGGWGQLGHGKEVVMSGLPVTVLGVDDAIAINLGWNQACLVHADHSASCWGANNNGQLGTGTNWDATAPVAVDDDRRVREIVTDGWHTCATWTPDHANQGGLSCWGFNYMGQIGNGVWGDDVLNSRPRDVGDF